MIHPLSPLTAFASQEPVAIAQESEDAVAAAIRIGVLLGRCQQLRRERINAEEVARLRSTCVMMAESAVARYKGLLGADTSTVDASATEAHGITPVQALCDLAEICEDEGLLQLADSLLRSTDSEFGEEGGIAARGQVVAHRARLARKGGDQPAAVVLYDLVREWADASGNDELHARAAIGAGLVARERGNIPELRRQFANALSAATRAGNPALTAVAHQGLMLAAAARQDFDVAVVHSWAAFRDVSDPRRKAEALLNVAQAVLDSGEAAVALHAFVAVLARPLLKRLELPSLGGAVIAAARIGDGVTVERLVRRIDALAASADLGFEVLSTRVDAVSALVILGATDVSERLAAVLADATTAGFNELTFRLENIEAERTAQKSQRSTSPEVRTVLMQLETLSNWSVLQGTI